MTKFISILLAICFLFALTGCSTIDSDKTLSTTEATISEKTTDTSITTATQKTTQKEPQKPISNVTIGESNALESAKDYLKYSEFSYEGLSEQLDYEGFTESEINYALENCGADWYEQAVKCAESYLKYSSFSYDELVDQLEYEGFTSEQAIHGANEAYGSNSNDANSSSIEKNNALQSAESYLDFSAFSYEGLIDQLEYEGYSTESAKYAVDNCGADWYEQAVKCAKSYLDYSSFSKSELIDQLEYEGFTSEQAIYGVEQNGY